MSADRLLAAYDRIANSPDAIPRIRRFVLDLAVRGKLVQQDSNEEPASQRLRRITAEKARLVRSGDIRRSAAPAPIEFHEFPFDLRSNWCWTRFGMVADFSAGRTPARNEPSYWEPGDHAWASIADMKDGEILTVTKESITKKAATQVFGSDPSPAGTIIMSFKLTIGKISRLGIPAYHNEAIISIRPYVSDMDSWLFKFLPQFARQGDAKKAIKGVTLNRKSITNIMIPIPPLGEQRRIISKVDELLEICDQWEASLATVVDTRRKLLDALLYEALEPAPNSQVTTPTRKASE